MVECWIETDEAKDVAGSIRHFLRSLEFAESDVHAWKWVALALHSALQGACVSHLCTSAAPVGAVTEKNAGEWLAYFEQSRANRSIKAPKTMLMSLPGLLEAIRKPNSAGDRSNPEGILITDPELAWLKSFHKEIRNQFVHFEPMGWSIDVSGIPELARLVSRIILDILNVGYGFRHLDELEQDELRNNLAVLSLE